jgi:hypothetical protein
MAEREELTQLVHNMWWLTTLLTTISYTQFIEAVLLYSFGFQENVKEPKGEQAENILGCAFSAPLSHKRCVNISHMYSIHINFCTTLTLQDDFNSILILKYLQVFYSIKIRRKSTFSRCVNAEF